MPLRFRSFPASVGGARGKHVDAASQRPAEEVIPPGKKMPRQNCASKGSSRRRRPIRKGCRASPEPNEDHAQGLTAEAAARCPTPDLGSNQRGRSANCSIFWFLRMVLTPFLDRSKNAIISLLWFGVPFAFGLNPRTNLNSESPFLNI